MPRHQPPAPPRLRPARHRDWPRVGLGWLTLVEVSSWLLTAAARWGSPRLLHSSERTWARATAVALGLQLEIRGLDHIDPDETYVVVSLHEGLIDPVVLLHLPLPLRFTVRDELFAWPALGRYLRASGQPSVPTDLDRAALRRLVRRSRQILDAGESLVVFPQGSVLGVEIAFAPGALRLGGAAGRPLLPVVVTGSHRVWEHPFSPTVRLGERVTARVLPPVDADTDLRRLEREMKRVALEPGMAAVRRFDPERDGWWDGYPFEIDPDFGQLAATVTAHRQLLGSEAS